MAKKKGFKIKSDGMAGRGVGTRGTITSSAEVAALLQQETPEEMRNRSREKPIEGGYLPIQDTYNPSSPSPSSSESNEGLRQALLGAVKNKKPTPQPSQPLNLSSLQDKISNIQQAAVMSGKEVKGVGGDYSVVLGEILNTLKQSTGLQVQQQGTNIHAYWVDEEGLYHGINKIHLGNAAYMAFSTMTPDNPAIEDNLAQVPYGGSLDEFKTNLEDFFCLLYSKSLGL